MSRKKAKNIIDVKDAIELFRAYSIEARPLNFYQIRLRDYETQGSFWDWYHTTGVLMRINNGNQRNVGVFRHIEDIAVLIQRYENAGEKLAALTKN